MPENSNDNDTAGKTRLHAPDPHGQAAMLLVESLLHGLIERSVISVDDAIGIVDQAIDVKQDVADDLGDTPGTLRQSLFLLGAISASLSADRGQT